MHATTTAPIANTAANPAIDPKRRYRCRHVFTDGHRCGSPSLRGQDLCYYHVRSRRDAPCATRGGTFVMSRIEDRPSVQLAIFDVLSRVAAGDIEYRRGSVLLYGLQIASCNLARQEKLLASQLPKVEEVTSDYDLGDLAPIVEIQDEASATPDTAPTNQPAAASEIAKPHAVASATSETTAPNAAATQNEAIAPDLTAPNGSHRAKHAHRSCHSERSEESPHSARCATQLRRASARRHHHSTRSPPRTAHPTSNREP